MAAARAAAALMAVTWPPTASAPRKNAPARPRYWSRRGPGDLEVAEPVERRAEGGGVGGQEGGDVPVGVDRLGDQRAKRRPGLVPLHDDLDVAGLGRLEALLDLGRHRRIERQRRLQAGDDAVGAGIVVLHEDVDPPRHVGFGQGGAVGHRTPGGPALGVGVPGQAEHPVARHRRRQGVGHDDRHVLLQDPGGHRPRPPTGDGEVGAGVVLGQLLGLGRVAGVVGGADDDLPATDAAPGVDEPQRQHKAEFERPAAAGGGARQITDRADLPLRSARSRAGGHPQRHRRQ
jgi:hypothetical protein